MINLSVNIDVAFCIFNGFTFPLAYKLVMLSHDYGSERTVFFSRDETKKDERLRT